MSNLRLKNMIHFASWIAALLFSCHLGRAEEHQTYNHIDDHRDLTVVPDACNGTFSFVKANLPSRTPLSEVVLGTYVNGTTIDIGPFNNAPLSLVVVCQSFFSYVTLEYRSSTIRENFMPYSLKGNLQNNYKAESDLNVVGTKKVLIKGYSSSTKTFETTIIFNIIKSSISSIYTTSKDFSLGRGINVNYNTDQIQLSSAVSASTPSEFMWVASAIIGTVVKIDTNTGAILGEYRTAPDILLFGATYPHFTTVDQDGSVWSANYYNEFEEYYGSVVHIGLKENNQCEDRNKNGVIDTSTGLGDVKDWNMIDINSADDECIIHYTKIPFVYLTHVSVNNDNDVWVGSDKGQFVLIKGGGPSVLDSGTIIRSESFVTSSGYASGYRGLISGDILWSGDSLFRWNTSRPLVGDNGDPIGPSIGPPVNNRNWALQEDSYSVDFYSYGFCMDKGGNVWNTGYEHLTDNYFIAKYDKNGVFLGQYRLGLYSAIPLGCVVDAREGGTNDVWITRYRYDDKFCAVDHLKNDGTFVGTVVNTSCKGSTLGVAVDAKGKIWVENVDNYSMSRINPTLGNLVGSTRVGAVDLTVPLGVGFYGYNNGDMTGSTLRAAPTTGNWLVVIDRTDTNYSWNSTTVSWNATVPAMSILTVTASSSNDGTIYSPSKSIFNGSILDSSIPMGRYLQIQVVLKREKYTSPSPIIYDLKVVSIIKASL